MCVFYTATSSTSIMGTAISSEDEFEIQPEDKWLHQKSTVRAHHKLIIVTKKKLFLQLNHWDHLRVSGI